MTTIRSILFSILCLLLFSCAQSEKLDAESDQAIAFNHPKAEQRPTMSLKQCHRAGGSVVGDIGDGRIHRPEFRCSSGRKPIASVSYTADQLMPVEGAVCCV